MFAGLAAALLAGCGRMAAESDPFGRTYRVGIAPWVVGSAQKKSIDAFLAALENAGYSSNSNLEVKIEDAGGSAKTQERIVGDFAGWKADLIYVLGAQGAKIAKAAPGDIPVVFSGVAYPLELGIVERLEFSSNQLVGIRSYIPIEEQMAFLARMSPVEIRRIGVCLRSGDPDSRLFWEEIRAMAMKQGAEVARIEVTDIPALMKGLSDAGSNVDAFYLSCDDLMQGPGASAVIDFASRRGIPILSCGMTAVEKGALAGAVADDALMGRMAGVQAAQILSGRTPTSLQTLTISPSVLVVNRVAAQRHGIRIPSAFMGEDVRVYE